MFCFRQIPEVVLSAVIASLKSKKDGVRILTLSYTGTTQEAHAARQKTRKMEQESHNEGASMESSIKDWTGSGVERRLDGSVTKVAPDP